MIVELPSKSGRFRNRARMLRLLSFKEWGIALLLVKQTPIAAAPPAGETGPSLAERVAAWHASDTDVPLHVWLGMSWDEYARWAEGPGETRDGREGPSAAALTYLADGLRRSLERFGRHLSGCDAEAGAECRCGLTASLASKPPLESYVQWLAHRKRMAEFYERLHPSEGGRNDDASEGARA